MTIPNDPTSGMVRGRRQWSQINARGVHIGDPSKVKLAPDFMLPRVILRGDVIVEGVRDYVTIGPWGSRGDYVTVTFRPTLVIDTGCFHGTLAQLRNELEFKPATDTYRIEYEALMALIMVLAETRARPMRVSQEWSED